MKCWGVLPMLEHEIKLPIGDVELAGTLGLPGDPSCLVIFAHGSGSSRFSPRNRRVAAHLHAAGMATLLFDLLTAVEESTGGYVFDVPVLAARLTAVTEWAMARPELAGLPIGYFGASTGAAAALVAAAATDSPVKAIVSRGGRPDLALGFLRPVAAPTLLIVGSLDAEVLELNKMAAAELRCLTKLEIVPGASHLFSEPGTLDKAAELAQDWFQRYCTRTP